ncbi:hypothetical protein [Aliarcobacter cryaerophilus]|uniref:hypothetical protein n=1 Tax=Aliarcobacter cryaerophilus TaxID=28198 RepID=UPI00112F579D|nr:hypothetical protein [Aliarcobacter cryaerophilus]MBP9950072.1 hypothetical protein [Negativicutes bacterium]
MAVDYKEEKWGELDLKYLVIDSQEYIVFIDNENQLDWITSDDYDVKGHADPSKHNSILHRVAVLECKPNGDLSDKVIVDFKRLLGEALSSSLSDDYEIADKIIDDAEQFIQNRGEELSRQWYLSTAGIYTLGILIAGVIAWLLRDDLTPLVGRTFFICSIAMVAGALGAMLSIIMRMGEEKLDIHAGETIHKLESKYRIFAGMLSSLLVALAVSSEAIFPIFSKVENPDLFLILIGFVGGMSERLAPSISSKLVGKSEDV